MHLETGDIIEEESDKFYGPKPFLAYVDEDPRSVLVAECVDSNGQPIFACSITYLMISAKVLLTQREGTTSG